MITVIGIWEPGYSAEQSYFEDTVWKQTLSAFGVDRFVMVSNENNEQLSLTNPEQYDTMEDALASCTGERVFMTFSADDATEIRDFVHPTDAVYVFGCPSDNLLSYIKPEDHRVHIDTPNNIDMLACSCVAATLYSRSMQ